MSSQDKVSYQSSPAGGRCRKDEYGHGNAGRGKKGRRKEALVVLKLKPISQETLKIFNSNVCTGKKKSIRLKEECLNHSSICSG